MTATFTSMATTESMRATNKIKGENIYSMDQDNKTVTNIPLRKWNIVWTNVIFFVILHSLSVYGIWLFITESMWKTNLLFYLYGALGGLGITAGTHRLWAHRSYKAKLPLNILLMILQSSCMQNSIYEWVRDHRVHHKFTDTDADPHNSRRGFFFSHIGWLMVKKHNDVFIKGKTVDLSDLDADPVVMFQKKYYTSLSLFFCFVIPTFIPWYFWNENLWVSFCVMGVLRYTFQLNSTWLVNSAAHIYGTKPYDKHINPRENRFVAWAALGEGWHNYHHVFPWDYKAAELGNYKLNFTTAFVDFMAKIHWAYDLKTVSPEMVQRRIARTGVGKQRQDGPCKDEGHHHHHFQGSTAWGWGDTVIEEDDKKFTKIYYKLSNSS